MSKRKFIRATYLIVIVDLKEIYLENQKVSIITPSYKSKKFIKQTIESVLAQTYQNWEMIIVDDMSPDNSNEIIENYIKKDNRIKLIKLNKNSGPAVARNKAIKESKGRYIAFLDADDQWFPQKLEKQITFMKVNNYAFTYTFYSQINEEGEIQGNPIHPPLKLSYTDMLKMNRIGCLTAIYDSKFLGKVYMPFIQKRQDYGLWLKILKQEKYAYCLAENLALYRIHSNSISRNKIELIKYHYTLFRKHEKLSVYKSIYYIIYNIFITLNKIKNT